MVSEAPAVWGRPSLTSTGCCGTFRSPVGHHLTQARLRSGALGKGRRRRLSTRSSPKPRLPTRRAESSVCPCRPGRRRPSSAMTGRWTSGPVSWRLRRWRAPPTELRRLNSRVTIATRAMHSSALARTSRSGRRRAFIRRRRPADGTDAIADPNVAQVRKR